MLKFIVRRVLLMLPTLIAVSILSFLIIQAPAGDFVDTYVAGLRQFGQIVEQGQIDALRDRYGLNQPVHVQYLKWMSNLIRGDLGRSFAWNQSVKTLLFERLPWTILIAFSSLLVVYIIAIPIGNTSAIHQYSVRDYLFTGVGFVGLAVPNFLFALIFLWQRSQDAHALGVPLTAGLPSTGGRLADRRQTRPGPRHGPFLPPLRTDEPVPVGRPPVRHHGGI